MRTFGIDVSHWEGAINWQAAAPSITFAYYKCTDGVRFVDNQFRDNQRGCDRTGLSHAPYHYFQPSCDPIAQAEHFIHTAGRQYQRYIVDIEAQERDQKITQKLQSCLARVESLTGIRPAIYTSAGYWNDFIQPQPEWNESYDLVVAHYTAAHTPILPRGWKAYILWQFSDFWSLSGSEASVDANWFNGTPEQCRKWFGNAHLPEPAQPPSTRKFCMQSLFDGLHIRQTPSLRSRVTGKLNKGDIVEVEQLGGSDAWVRHARGWTCVETNGYRYMNIVGEGLRPSPIPEGDSREME